MTSIRQAITEFFNETLNIYKADQPLVVGWSSKETQQRRFDILLQLANLNHFSILDVGCGVGDLYPELIRCFPEATYTGIDLHPRMIHLAREKYPAAVFKHTELKEVEERADVVLVSGAFNLAVDDNYAYLDEQIGYAWRTAKKAVAFNLLSAYSPLSMRFDKLYYYDPGIVLERMRRFTTRMCMRHEYLDNDFTVYLYKNN